MSACMPFNFFQVSLELSSKNLIKDSCGIRAIGLWLGCRFALHNYTCSITKGMDSISSSSQGSLGTGQGWV